MHRTRLAHMAALLIASLAVVGAVAAPASADVGSYSISGTVRHADTSTFGDDEVEVTAYLGPNSTPAGRAETDAAGHYVISGLGPGTYVLFFDAADPQLQDCWLGGDPPAFRTSSDDVTILSADQVANQTIYPHGAIQGRVALGNSSAFASTGQVRVDYAPGFSADGHMNPDLGQVQSIGIQADGTFLIPDLESGYWMLRFVPISGLGFGFRDWNEVGVGTTGTTTNSGTVVLSAGGSISGHIDVTGQSAGAGDVQVLLKNEYGEWLPIAETDADGHYVTLPLNTGYYRLRLHYTGPRSIADEWFHGLTVHSYSEPEAGAVPFSPTAGGGFNADLQAGADFKGTALDTAGNPVSGASIQARAYYPNAVTYGWTFRTESGADGRFDLRGLAPAGPDFGYTFLMNDTADRFPVPRTVYHTMTVGQQLTTNIRYYLKNTLTATLDCAACTVSPYPQYLGHFEKLSSSGSWVKVNDFLSSSINFYSLGNIVPGKYRMRFTATGLPTLYVDPFTLAEGQSIDFGLIGKSYAKVGSLSVSGSAKVGSLLKATLGTFSPAQSATSYVWLRDGVPIDNAVGSTYTPTGDDLGHSLKAQATVTRSGYTTRTITSAATAKVALGGLTGTTPKISGTVRVGSVLTVTAGAWSPGADLAIQWRVNGAAVAGETTTSYPVRPADVGKAVTVSVTATKEFYATLTKTSAATASVASAPFLSSPVPAIDGTAQVGEELSVDAGVWDPAAALTYRWYADGTFIPGATHETFTPTGSQLGKKISVKVTAKLLGYTTTSRTSASTSSVARGVWLATPDITVVGNNRVGSLLSVDKTGWQSNATFKYRWYANGVAIDGATKSTFTPTSSMLGKSLKVKVTTTTSGYPVWSQTVVLPTPVARGEFASTPVPVITGTSKVGSTLKVTPGAWSPTPTLKYQWLADGLPISGATASTYKIGASKEGTVITVKVTGSRSGFTTVTQESDGTAPVAP